jgi:hypothetical protein
VSNEHPSGQASARSRNPPESTIRVIGWLASGRRTIARPRLSYQSRIGVFQDTNWWLPWSHLLLFRIPAGFTERLSARSRGLELIRTITLDSAVTAACYDDQLRLLFVGQVSSVKNRHA